MAAHYKAISIEEMRDFLKKEKGWKEGTQYKEIVFNYSLNKYPFIQLKVYTGINAILGDSRAVGKDALRCCAIDTRTNPPCGFIKARRCNRVENWQTNLRERILQVIRQSEARLRPNS